MRNPKGGPPAYESGFRLTQSDEETVSEAGREAMRLIAAQLDEIRRAAQRIQEVENSPWTGKTADLAASIETSTDRALSLLKDLLDPRDNRGLYHEVGGSG